MTEPLRPPPKKNPQIRTPVPHVPPMLRSRAALGLTLAAAEGRFMLQACAACGALQYPPRDACRACLSTDLRWQDVPPEGELLAETRVQTSPDLYFRARTPWCMGMVRLDAGVSILCHLHGDCATGTRVRLISRLDRAGQGVIMARPIKASENMEDDPELRELSAHPRHRRVLITDARAPEAPALAEALLAEGASMVFMGEAEGWRTWPGRERLAAMERVHLLPLDVTDTSSVRELAGEIGGKTDILINNARHIRPGGLLARGDTVFARDELEVTCLGLMRLAQAFAPAMRARGGDGTNSAVAWVNILSANALAGDPSHAASSAAHAAAASVLHALRAELRPGGVRVMRLWIGPVEDEWHQEMPPPKLTPGAIARAVVQGLVEGLEEMPCGDVARDLWERWRRDALLAERERLEGGA